MTIDITKLTSSSGGGSFIGQLMPISTPKILYKAPDDTEWLRTGYIETDTTSYPDSENVVADVEETDGTTFPTLTGPITSIFLMSYDKVSQKLYVIDSSANCDEYTKTGVFIRTLPNKLNSGDNTSVTTFAVNDGVIYVSKNNELFYYDIDGVFQSSILNLFGGGSPQKELIYHEGYLIYMRQSGSTFYLYKVKADGSEDYTELLTWNTGSSSSTVTGIDVYKGNLLLSLSYQNALKIFTRPLDDYSVASSSPTNSSVATFQEVYYNNTTANAGLYVRGATVIDDELVVTQSIASNAPIPSSKYPIAAAVGEWETLRTGISTSDYVTYYKRIK